MKTILFGLLALSLLACSPGEDSLSTIQKDDVDGAGIIGGTLVPDGQATSLAAIVQAEEKEGKRFTTSFCSGTVLSKRHILTTVGCVENAQSRYYVSSPHDLAKRKVTPFDVESINRYPKSFQNELLANKLAIVRTTQDLPPSFVPVEIADTKVSVKIGDEVLALGLGNNKSQARQAYVQIYDPAFYSDAYYAKYKNGLMLSVQSGSGALCTGDNGGPVFLSNKGRLQAIGILGAVLFEGVKFDPSKVDESCLNQTSAYLIRINTPEIIAWIQSQISQSAAISNP